MTSEQMKPHWALRALGAVALLAGLYLLVGGAYLMSLGGSWYYVIAGLGLVASGVLIFLGRILGVVIYLATFIFTVCWTYYDTGLNFWGWVPRTAAPLVIAIAVLLSVPLFRGRTVTPLRSRLSVTGGLALIAVFAVFFAQMLEPHGIVRNDISITPGKETETTAEMGGEWREWGRTGEGVRYSPLDQITKDNVGDLEVVWTAHHGQIPDAALANEDQNTPLYADGTLFHCAYNNVVTAFDGTTGKEKWVFNPHASAPLWLRCRSIAYVDSAVVTGAAGNAKIGGISGTANRKTTGSSFAPDVKILTEGATDGSNTKEIDANLAANAGDTVAEQSIEAGKRDNGEEETADANASTTNAAVADSNETADVSEDCGPRIVVATVDGRLMSIRTSDGKLCTSFGEDGVVDLHEGMGSYFAGEYMPTTGAILAGNKIIIGGWVMDNRSVGEAPGVVRAYNAITGALEWAWDSGNPKIDTYPPRGESYTRGTPNVWAPMSYDLELNMVYLPTGNATPDYWGGERSDSDNKYSSSVVALNLDTGKEVWHFQTTHHDLWDYDLASQPALVDFPKADGTTVPAVVQLTKRGEIFVLDRRDGTPLTKVTEQPVPQGSARGEYYSPTQPFSTGMPSIGSDDSVLSENKSWGMTPFDHLYCRIRTMKTRWDGLMTPPSTDVYYEFPGNGGGFNWGSASFDQSRNLLVLNNMIWPNRTHLIETDTTGGKDLSGGSEGGPMAGTPYQVFIGYNILEFFATPCFEPPFGTVTAIDLATQKIKWQIPMGTTEDTGPFGLRTYLPINTGMPTLGGLLTTKPGLSFFAGTQDYYLRAIDTETGDIVWKSRLPVGSQSVPITYTDENNRQIIVVQAAGARHSPNRGDYLIAYALKEK
ncbi:glucose dehydrogenase (plasmid) [Hoeflea sp. IMCC20628]|nr:glucose dehydrogenase [Hoeflea sp. IMCC20628]